MAITDFLFGGTAPPEVSTFSSTTANVPDWWASYVKGTIAKASQIAGEPYQAYTGPRVAGDTADQTAAYDATRANVGNYQPSMTQAGNLLNTAGSTSSIGAAQPYIDAAQGLSASTAAQPYLNQASQTLPGSINSYMSPYTENVTNRIAELGNRNLTEKMLPALQDQFIAAGQPGSTRGSEFASRAVRDTANEIAGQQAEALERGYATAGQQFQADQARQAGLASTAGGLAGAEQTNLANLGALAGQTTSDTANRQVTAGNALTNLGAQQQVAGIKDAAALQSIGQEQQAQQQRNLDTAYSDFAEQRAYPAQQIGLLNQAIRGVNMPTSSTTQGSAPATAMGPSPLAALAGVGTTLAGLKEAKVFRRGGHVDGYADGGSVEDISEADAMVADSLGGSDGGWEDIPYTDYVDVPRGSPGPLTGYAGETEGRRLSRLINGGEEEDIAAMNLLTPWLQATLEQRSGRDPSAPTMNTNLMARVPVGAANVDLSAGNYADAHGGNHYSATGGLSTRIPIGPLGVSPGARVGARRSIGPDYDTGRRDMPVTGTLGLDMPIGVARALLNMERPRGGRTSYSGGVGMPLAGGDISVDAQYSPKDGEMAERRALMAQYRRNF